MFHWILLLLFPLVWAGNEELKGLNEVKVTPSSEEQFSILRRLTNENQGKFVDEGPVGYPSTILIPQRNVESFISAVKTEGIDHVQKTVENVYSILEREKNENDMRKMFRSRDITTYFAQHAEINNWLDQLVRQYSDIATTEVIGSSHHGRKMKILKVSTGHAKGTIFIDAGIHAREWLAPATLINIIDTLLKKYKAGDANAVKMLNKYNWYFLPVVNPDGYTHTFNGGYARYWRKTRKPYGYAYGADPNRNFDVQFGGPSTSRDPQSDLYHGPHAFSEACSKALSLYLTRIRGSLKMYISFHTYGQLWLTPYAYSRIPPKDNAEMVRVATAGVRALQSVYGIKYKIGQPANVGLYEAAGGSYDWVKAKLGVKYAYTLELRPKWPAGMQGFVASIRDIKPTGKETYEAMIATANALPY